MWKWATLILLVTLLMVVFSENRDELGERFRSESLRYRDVLLLRASAAGNRRAVGVLVRLGADVGARDAQERSPLALAAGGGHAGVASALLRAGAEVDACDRWGNTPLFLAADAGRPAAVEILLAADADPQARNMFDWTARRVAEFRGHHETARLLPEPPADEP